MREKQSIEFRRGMPRGAYAPAAYKAVLPPAKAAGKGWRWLGRLIYAILLIQGIRAAKIIFDGVKEGVSEVSKANKKLAEKTRKMMQDTLESFPTAEDDLRAKGLDPALAQELAPGQTIRVLKDNAAGKLGMKILFGDEQTKKMMKRNDVYGFATPNALSPFFNDICIIYLKENEKGGNPDTFFSARGWRRLAELHEIGHASKENHALPAGFAKEADTHYRAAVAFSKTLHDPSLVKRALYDVALIDDTDHDVSLYFDAKMRGVAVPATEEMTAANAEAWKAMKSGIVDAFKLSPLALRRVELYNEAVAPKNPLRLWQATAKPAP